MIKKRNWKPLGKRHNWIERNKGDILYELIIWDSGMKLDRFIFNTGRKFKEILELLRLKYGLTHN